MSGAAEDGSRAADLKRAVVAIRTLRKQVHDLESRAREPIAVVGMSCRFPGGANTPQRYWQLLQDGVDATTEIPPDRWDVDDLYDPDPEKPGTMYVRRGGFLREPIDEFDAAFFGISPREAASLDPLQRLLLELGWEALESGGIAPHTLEGSATGVFVGLSGSDFESLRKQGERLEDIDAYRGTGTALSVAAGRISHTLGLRGPNLTVDTACSSSLSAVVSALDSLRAGRCDLALAGGAHLMLAPDSTVLLCRMRALSVDGRCRTFDEAADGYARGEGGGLFVLKRLSDAQADGDLIHAVLRGGALNHDGRSSGLTVPNPSAQRAVIQSALENAGLKPGEVDFVEAHGTATPLGDPIELRVVAEVLGDATNRDTPLLIGSAKTNFGHLEAAAGVAGLMKAILAVSHRRLPQHLNVDRPTTHVDWDRIPLRIATDGADWTGEDRPLRGGVSAFGFSGTNAHVLVESPPAEATFDAPAPRDTELLPLSAGSEAALGAMAGAVAEQLRQGGDELLPHLARTLADGRTPMPWRAAVVADNSTEMTAALDALAGAPDRAAHPRGTPDRPLAFIFTGQGAQYPGMGRELMEGSPLFRDVIERCDALLTEHLDRSLISLLVEEEDPEVLRQTKYAQPALFCVEFGLATLWQSWGIVPSYLAGHSLGEYVAATVSGVLRLEDALPLVALRGRLMQALPEGGAMLAIDAGESRTRAVLEEVTGSDVSAGAGISGINGPESTVISGDTEAIGRVQEALEGEGVRCTRLTVSHAFHSHRMEPILDRFQAAVSEVELRPPGIPLISNLTGEPMTATEATDPARWARHIREAVRWGPSVADLAQRDVGTFLEVGPHPTLSAMGASALPDPDLRWVPSLRRGQPHWRRLLTSLGDLFEAGHEIDWTSYARDRGGRRVTAPTYRFQRERHWNAPRPSVGRDSGPGRSARAAAVHPLLGSPLRSPAIDGWAFEQVFSDDDLGYLGDHRVGGRALMPGAAMIEMALAATREGPGWPDARVDALTFERPLFVPEAGAVLVQTVLSAPRDGVARLQIVTASTEGVTAGASDPEWVTVASAQIVQTGAGQPAAPEPDDEPFSLAPGDGDPVDLDALHSALASRGLDYGPAFRTLTAAWTSDRSAMAEVSLAESERGVAGGGAGHLAHPALVDAGLQLMGALVGSPDDDIDDTTTVLPFGVDEVRLYRPLGDACTLQVTLRGVDSEELPPADIHFRNADGALLGTLRGFRARRVQQPQRFQATGEYRIEWMPVSPEAEPEPGPPQAERWLVLDSAEHEADPWIAHLEDLGAQVVRVDPGSDSVDDSVDDSAGDSVGDSVDDSAYNSPDDPAHGFSGVLNLRGLDGSTPDSESDSLPDRLSADSSAGSNARSQAARDADPTDRIAGAILALGSILKSGSLREGARILSVTRGAVTAGDASDAAHAVGAALWGMHSALRAEHAELPIRILDLDEQDDLSAEATRWLFDSGPEDRVALRRGRSLAPRLTLATGTADRTPAVLDAENYALQLDERGTLEAIRYAPSERPAPGPGEVEVELRATGMNFRDVLNVLGQYPGDPGNPGVEFSGVVERVGPGVDGLTAGDPVIGMHVATFTRYLLAPATSVVPCPEGIDFDQAAALPVAFLTAEWGLRHLARLQPGERVLIHAGAGGVGQAAIQVARALGAKVFTTASEKKRPFLRGQGVEHVFDSRSTSFHQDILDATDGAGVDVVLNSLTGEMLQRSLDLLGPGGRFIELGKRELYDPETVAEQHPGVAYHPFELGTIPLSTEEYHDFFREVAERFESRELHPPRVHAWPGERITEAFRHMAQGRHIGKLVVRPVRLASELGIRTNGAYLVTGATGGVGRELVEWLVAQGAGAVIATARSQPEGATAECFDRLRAEGATVLFAQMDVTERAGVDEAVQVVRGTGFDLRGVFHAAGVLDDRLLRDVDRESVERVLGPKLRGAWNLHRATEDEVALDHFVMFSSAATWLGGPGQSTYAAANACMAALGESRRASGLPAMTVDWGPWAGGGMISRLDERARQALERSGMRLLQPRDALQHIARLIRSRMSRTLIAEIDWSRVAETSGARAPFLQELMSGRAGPTQQPSTPALDTDELAPLTAEDRRTRVTTFVTASLAAVLGLATDRLEPETALGAFGFDSLMAVELRNRIDVDAGITLPATELLGGATVRDIAEQLLIRLEAKMLDADGDARSGPTETFEF